MPSQVCARGKFRCQSGIHPDVFHSQIRTPQTCGDPALGVPFYRTYHSGYVDHWYTSGVNLINEYLPQGYPLEGVTGLVFVTSEPGTTQLYRLFSQTVQNNYYTTSTAERDAALKNGYLADELWSPKTWIYANQICGSIPLFHLYNGSQKDSFYTTSDSERIDFISNREYVEASIPIEGYVLPVGPSQCA
ncbi:hypothetical protein K438DRAFT_1593415 [Mycena galopus ATCC 62051]|nr:hypothetical protein K438DRAFT_1593415 [Mycena galopus ATCC 62051]